VYVTACDLEKSFIYNDKVEITSRLHFQFMCKHTVVKTRYFLSYGHYKGLKDYFVNKKA